MSLRKKVISGVKWSTLSTTILVVVNLLKIAILTRLLAKSDFGIIAIVTTVLGFVELFMDMGIPTAILHKQRITRKEYASLYWFNLFFSVSLIIIIFFISPFIAQFFDEPLLKKIIPIMSFSILFAALGKQFKIISQKKLHFKYISIVEIISATCGLITCVTLAICKFGVYALVFGILTQHIVLNFIFLIKGLINSGIVFYFNFTKIKSFLKIGIYQTGSQIINFFNKNLDVFIIGKIFGSEILGGYNLAKQLAWRPLQIIDPIMIKITNSIFPKFQDNKLILRQYFLKLLKGMSFINSIVYGLIATYAYYIVLLFYGNKFIEITPYVQAFCFVMCFRSLGGIIGILAVTTGRTNYEFYWNIFTTLIIPPVIVIASIFSINMIIIFLGIINFVFLLLLWNFFYKKLISLSFRVYIKSFIFQLILMLIMVLMGVLLFNGLLIWKIFISLTMIILLTINNYSFLKEIRTRSINKNNKSIVW